MMVSKKVDGISQLSWDAVVDQTADLCLTEPARQTTLGLLSPTFWAQSVEECRQFQAQLKEAQLLSSRSALWVDLRDLPSPFQQLERLDRDAVLEVKEIANLYRWLLVIDTWKDCPATRDTTPLFFECLMNRVFDPRDPLRLISKIIGPGDEVAENASPELFKLFSQKRILSSQIKKQLDIHLKNYEAQGIVQDQFSDYVDGRYVLPIKSGSQSKVDGIIHSKSSSGQTVFIEPEEISGLNLELRRCQSLIDREIFRLLTELCRELKPHIREIAQSVETISEWDSFRARALFSKIFAGKPIDVNTASKIQLSYSANPMLWLSLKDAQIIRNSIEFEGKGTTLLLTGPNTGGKTVILKLLGLAAIFSRTGFGFPSEKIPRFPFFKEIYVDIGDPQAVEQSVSSFSGHIVRFKKTLEACGENSLVLLDEINSSTDPEEGSALSRAIIETLMEKGCTIVVTTHDPHLKALALQNPKIINASLSFDEDKLEPTYQLVFGTPGRSRAIETAARLGLPLAIIEKANSFLSESHSKFEGLLKNLELFVKKSKEDYLRAKLLKDEAEAKKIEWEKKLESELGNLLNQTREKLQSILGSAQKDINQAVSTSKQSLSFKKSSELKGKLKDKELEIESSINELVGRHIEVSDVKPVKTDNVPFAPGQTVELKKWKKTGVIEKLVGDVASVRVGTMSIQSNTSDLTLIKQAENTSNTTAHIQLESYGTPGLEIDVRGKTVDEALSEVSLYLDQAFIGKLHEVRIIHGLGTGALKKAITSYLKNSPYVSEFTDAGPGLGGAGATLVQLNL